MGIELDFIYKIMDNLDLQGLVSLGDWTWDKQVKEMQFYDYDSNDPVNMIIDFDARSATVFFGMGRRFITSLRITF